MRMILRTAGREGSEDPLLIFDKSNADTAGKPAQVSTGYGDAYLAGYRQLWKLAR